MLVALTFPPEQVLHSPNRQISCSHSMAQSQFHEQFGQYEPSNSAFGPIQMVMRSPHADIIINDKHKSPFFAAAGKQWRTLFCALREKMRYLKEMQLER